VSTVDRHTLYVTGIQGNTVAVQPVNGATVTTTVHTSVGRIHPGDTVVVQGSQGGNGVVHATSIRVTPSGGSPTTGGSGSGQGSAGGALNQLFGGGNGAGGG
jgi:hypothetical protein